MGLKVTTDEKGVTVFANEKDGANGKYTLYSVGISSKNQNNEWVNGYINVRFKKGVSVPNKTKIKINNAFYTVTKSGDKAYTSLMITDFENLDEKEEWVNVDSIPDNELPFAD